MHLAYECLQIYKRLGAIETNRLVSFDFSGGQNWSENVIRLMFFMIVHTEQYQWEYVLPHVFPIPRNLRTAVQLYSHGMAGIHILLDTNSSSKSTYRHIRVFTVSWISFSTRIFETAAGDFILWILKQYLLQGRMSSVVTAIVRI